MFISNSGDRWLITPHSNEESRAIRFLMDALKERYCKMRYLSWARRNIFTVLWRGRWGYNEGEYRGF
jgi:hypothetical protein